MKILKYVETKRKADEYLKTTKLNGLIYIYFPKNAKNCLADTVSCNCVLFNSYNS